MRKFKLTLEDDDGTDTVFAFAGIQEDDLWNFQAGNFSDYYSAIDWATDWFKNA